ncbi:TP0733 family outer membrane beta-barrel protein [Treponema pectinovorum]|uniref:TP0733 family outer membrane beta-barrel protein n=1 Tax=Treponema pectinovorum TaxID=164 RepID=UPI0011C7A418|nr:hypothetical protein [Treponema pectinovorum]
MKKILLLLCSALFMMNYAFSQNSSTDDEEKSGFSAEYKMNEPGDQFINIGLMVTFPLNFGGTFPLYRDGQLSTGGAGLIGYHRFITSNFAVGFDISFGYNPTIGQNMFTYVPFTFCFTYQPTYKRFEFPISLGVGAAVESYLNRTYFPGFVLKPELGIFYRVTPSWSFGTKGNYLYMPQWYSDSSKNDVGYFSSIVVAARYHF